MSATSDRRALASWMRAAHAALAERDAPGGSAGRGGAPAPSSGRLSERRYDEWARGTAGAPSAAEQRASHGGSWRGAKRSAGLKACGPRVLPVSPSTARRDLRRALAAHRTTTGDPALCKRDYAAWAADNDAVSLHRLERALGGWSRALIAVGATPGHWTLGHHEQELLAALRALAERLGRAPSMREWDRLRPPGSPGRSVYVKRFGSWPRALQAAGLTPTYAAPLRRCAKARS